MNSKYFLFSTIFFLCLFLGLERSIYWFSVFSSFVLGFFLHFIFQKKRWLKKNSKFDRISSSFQKSTLKHRIVDTKYQNDGKIERETLTGNDEIDQPLFELVDLFVRDFVEIWYKNRISSDETFIVDLKTSIYIVIRHLTSRLKEIDWLDFFTGTLVDNFSTHVRLYRKAKEKLQSNNSNDVCALFFDLEAELERGICRDEVCLDREKEKNFLRDLIDVLLYILLPANDFRCAPTEKLLREILLNFVFVQFFDIYSEPDTINQLIIVMCQQIPVTIENFLLVVRTSASRKELLALRDRLEIETKRCQSHDTGGQKDSEVRATLSSFRYLKQMIDQRIEKEFDDDGKFKDEEEPNVKNNFREISLSELLKNVNGVDFFSNFLKQNGGVELLDFFLTVQIYREVKSSSLKNFNEIIEEETQIEENCRIFCRDIVDRFLLPTSEQKLMIDENFIQKVFKSIEEENFNENLFDEIQNKIFEILSSEKFFGKFKSSNEYFKFLSEIDFTDSINDNSDSASISSNEILFDQLESPLSSISNVEQTKHDDAIEYFENYLITTKINDSVICVSDRNKFAVYLIEVTCKPVNSMNDEEIRQWIVYRRYSEFNDLYMTIKQRFPKLKDFAHFPKKNFVDNTSIEVRKKRGKELNDYLMTLIEKKLLQENPNLRQLLWKFIRNEFWVHEQSDLLRAIDTLSNPFKQAATGITRSVSKIGDGITNVSDSVAENAAKLFRTNSTLNKESNKFSIVEENQLENLKNIPLRVLLVIFDEIFDLKQKNLWFRSRFVSILKGFLKTFMGNSVNRRISAFVQHWTSSKKIAKEIRRLKENFWPNGVRAESQNEREETVRCVTEVLCKAKLLGLVSDEIRHIVGSRTTRRGLFSLFELLQNRTLNRRFVFVILESLLIKLFRPNELNLVFDKLYSKSDRVKEEFRRKILGEQSKEKNSSQSSSRPFYFPRLIVRNEDENLFTKFS